MKEYQRIIRQHSRHYPAMQPEDVAKLLYQNEFGPGHLVKSSEISLKRIEEEYNLCRTKKDPFPIEDIGNGLVRYALFQLKEEELEALNRIFIATANKRRGKRTEYEKKLNAILLNSELYEFSFTREEYAAYIEAQKKENYPIVSHSEQYRDNYQPAYRVIEKRYVPYIELVAQLLKKKVLKKARPFVVGIDGNSAAGKTTLAEILAELFQCEVIHMDDFFLPPELRTEARLREPGGNVHYERFKEEVCKGIWNRKELSYQVFSCHEMDYTGKRTIPLSDTLIVEGAYSMRPEFREIYDYKIFMKINDALQMNRIIKRNGEEMSHIFKSKWIPMENLYFQTFSVEEACDYVIR